jgi:8-oxo-dGTP pyrophosphatase MutT (NUDIX family)
MINHTLDEIIPNNIFVGTSLILRQRDVFLYGMRPEQNEGKKSIIELTGIGGGVEEDDESYSAGVKREAQEETGSRVDLIDCEQTLLVRGLNQVERLNLAGEERPAAIVFRKYRTPPHQPWHQQNAGEACLIVYFGELLDHPKPIMELPWLIWLSADQVLQTAQRDVRLDELIGDGAVLFSGDNEPPQTTNWIRMTDSQEALAIALGSSFVNIYETFGKI